MGHSYGVANLRFTWYAGTPSGARSGGLGGHEWGWGDGTAMIDDRRYRNLMTGRAPIYSATRGRGGMSSMSRQSSFLIRRNSSMMNQRFDVVRPRGGTAAGHVFPKVEIHVTASYQTGKRIHNAMTITKVYDKSTVKLLEKLNMGEVIPKLEIEQTATYGENISLNFSKY